MQSFLLVKEETMKNLIKNFFMCGCILCGTALGSTSCGGSSGGLKIVHFEQSILGDTQKELGVSIGIKKGNSDLQTKINGALATLDSATRSEWMIDATARSNGTMSEGEPITLTHDDSKPTLKVGLECNYAPFNRTDTTKNDYNYEIAGKTNAWADGYDIQVAKYICQQINYNLEIISMGWDALIPSLQASTVDAVIAGMTDTEERRLSIDFTDEYYRSEMVLVVKSESIYASATSLEDFKGAKIVSQKETVTDKVIADWASKYGVVHLNALTDFATCALSVQTGSADAMTAELPVATSIVNGANL